MEVSGLRETDRLGGSPRSQITGSTYLFRGSNVTPTPSRHAFEIAWASKLRHVRATFRQCVAKTADAVSFWLHH